MPGYSTMSSEMSYDQGIIDLNRSFFRRADAVRLFIGQGLTPISFEKLLDCTFLYLDSDYLNSCAKGAKESVN